MTTAEYAEKIVKLIQTRPRRMNPDKLNYDMLRAVESLRWSPFRCPSLYETPICRYPLFKKYRIAFRSFAA